MESALDEISRSSVLPLLEYSNQKAVVLDGVDETLIIHRVDAAVGRAPIPPENHDDFVLIRCNKGKRQVTVYILKRRYLDDFLQYLNDGNFETAAAGEGYDDDASLVLDKLDSKAGLIRHRLYRGSCKKVDYWRISVEDLPVLPNPGRPLLPPLTYPTCQKTVVLDLDETLIHNVTDTDGDGSIPPNKTYDFLFQLDEVGYYILKRPFVDEFLQCLSENKFEIVVFTAGTKRYASRVLDLLDPKGLITHRLSRESCKEVDGCFIKDLSRLGRDLRKVVIVDDRPSAYSLHPNNAIPIKPFTDDLQDDELVNLMGYFRESRDEEFFKEFEETKDYRNV